MAAKKSKPKWDKSSYGDSENGSVYLPIKLRERAKRAADGRSWSFSKLIENMLEKHLPEYES